MPQTRLEHLNDCKARALMEFDFYMKEGIQSAVRNGMTSMASDIRKHPENNRESLVTLCIMMIPQIHSRQEFIKFLEGFN